MLIVGIDDDKLRDALEAQGVRLLAPHRENRVKPPRHDGRHLRRCRRRWIDERNNRRSTVDWQFTTADARIKLKRLYPSVGS